MCSIFGALVAPDAGTTTHTSLQHVWRESAQRGRDSCGVHNVKHGASYRLAVLGSNLAPDFQAAGAYIGNRRAEPTTEWVEDKSFDDVQPFQTPGGWHIAHNGTIANDKEIIAELAGLEGFFEPRTSIDTEAIAIALDVMSRESSKVDAFGAVLDMLSGSFALIAAHEEDPTVLYYAANYKPMWVQSLDNGKSVVVASQKSYLFDHGIFEPAPTVIEPYSWGFIDAAFGVVEMGTLYDYQKPRTLVVCSGGLDSTVAAAFCKKRGDDVTLMHFLYGAKAETREVEAVTELARLLDAPLEMVSTSFFKEQATSVLTDDSRDITTGFDGAAGAEYGHEWVPARNTVMMALALAYAEAHGFTKIVLGNNLEESGGGYPDNEQEFINRWQDLVPYAVKPYTRIEFEQPLGTLMKHEIVKLGAEVNAPFETSWSCYSGGEEHCGTCGPCFMRKTAFKMNGLTDPVMPSER